MFPQIEAFRSFTFATLISIVSIPMAMQPATAQTISHDSTIQTLLDDRLFEALNSAEQIGNAGIVLHNGEVIAQSHNGLRQKDTTRKIGPNDKWHIGSITKSMTATMIGRLVDKGLLDFDATIGELLPNHTTQIDAAWRSVKLIELLQHISGAKANFGVTTMLKNDFADQAAVQQAREQAVLSTLSKPPQNTPNTTFVYSNIGYTIAGFIAEQVTQKSWETLLQEELFAPLQLASAGFGAPKGDQPWGHSTKFFLFTNAVDPNNPAADNTPIIGPAGTVHMSIKDLANYGQMHLDTMTGDTPYMSAMTEQRLHAPSELTKNSEKYAAGWAYIPLQNRLEGEALFHNGSNTMWYAYLAISMQHNVVAAFVTNSSTIASSDEAFSQLFQDVLLNIEKAERP